MSLTEADAATGSLFQPYEGGTEVFGRTSLDLCFGDFPSEELRSGRNQVGIGDEAGTAWVSSEAILYPTPEDAEQAMAELEKAREQCPTEPVEPPQPDREALAWEFAPAPDADWPQEPGVTRQAYEFEATNPAGETWTSTATYLQRGSDDPRAVRDPARQPCSDAAQRPRPGAFRRGHDQPARGPARGAAAVRGAVGRPQRHQRVTSISATAKASSRDCTRFSRGSQAVS